MRNNKKSKNGFGLVELLLLVAILIVVGGIGYVFLEKGKIKQELSEQVPQSQEKNKESEIQKNTIATTTKKITTDQIFDCGTTVNFQKFECFISAAKNCSPTKITSTVQADLFGLISESTTFYEIKGWQENKCVFYIKSMSGKVTFSQETIQRLLDSGTTNEQIKQQEQELSETAQLIANRDGICKFVNTSNLISLLNKWQEGSFSTNDFKGVDCKGEYFGQGERPVNTSKTITDQQCSEQKGYYTAVTDTGTACFKNQIDLGTIIGSLKMNDKYPQCCVYKQN